MAVDDGRLEMFKGMLDYSDEQFAIWKSHPRNLRLVENMEEIGKYRLIAEVIESHGCIIGHKPGDKFHFTGNGALLCGDGPPVICTGALAPLMAHTYRIVDKVGAGLDPMKYTFNRVACIDVGVEHGGWGKILMEIKVEKTE